VLGFDGFGAATLADEFFLIFHFGEKFDDLAGIVFEVGRIAVDGRFQS
jgi:hypothetical protein